MISTTLQSAYQNGLQAGRAQQAYADNGPQQASGAAPLTPEVKNLIAAEVQRQIALENAEAGAVAQNGATDPANSGIQRMLSDRQAHALVAGASIDAVDSTGRECTISAGDVVQFAGPVDPDSTTAIVTMRSSQGGAGCKSSEQVSISIADLQDMQNHMRESIDSGLGDMQAKQGTGGFPRLPAAAAAAPAPAPYAAAAGGPDPNAAAEISQQWTDAEKAEQDALAQVPADSGVAAAPAPAVALGQSRDDVTGILGPPVNIVNVGAKQILVYADRKIILINGKVTSIQ
jgi:hypothetical protein